MHDPFLSVTARYADIVLPAATYLETEDFFRAYGTYYMQYSHRAVEPQGEAWSNLRLAQDPGAAHGFAGPGIPYVRSARSCASCSAVRAARRRLSMPDELPDAGPMSIAPKDGQEFRTPSGKLEFCSASLAAQGLPPMPDWQPEPAPAGKLPSC